MKRRWWNVIANPSSCLDALKAVPVICINLSRRFETRDRSNISTRRKPLNQLRVLIWKMIKRKGALLKNAQRRPWSACAFAQADQGPRCSPVNSAVSRDRVAKILSRGIQIDLLVRFSFLLQVLTSLRLTDDSVIFQAVYGGFREMNQGINLSGCTIKWLMQTISYRSLRD